MECLKKLKDASKESSLGKIIHVPQGRSARLMKETLPYGIEGLYTQGFSICNIIAAIGQDKLVLIHADQAGSRCYGKTPWQTFQDAKKLEPII